MAILFRTMSALTVNGMEARLTVYSGTDRVRVELEPYSPITTAVYSGALDVTVTYNGTSANLTAQPFAKAVSAVFPFVPAVKELTLSSASPIVYGGTSGMSHTLAWKGDGSVPAPSPAVSYYSGLMINRLSRVEWTFGEIPSGYRAYTLGVWLHYAEKSQIAPEYTRSIAVGEKTTAQSYEHTIDGLEAENVIFYRIAVGLYPEGEAAAAGRDDYVAYAEIDSPAYVCSGSSIYTLAPCNFRYGAVVRNRAVTLSWDILPAALETGGVEIHYRYNGDRGWYLLYRGESGSNRCTFTVTQDWKTIVFRINSYSTRSQQEESEHVYGPEVEIGRSNVYVGHGGNAVPAAEVYVGGRAADAVLHVG